MNTIDRINKLNEDFGLAPIHYQSKRGELDKAIRAIERQISPTYTSVLFDKGSWISIDDTRNYIGRRLNRLEGVATTHIKWRGKRRYYFHLGADN